MDSIVDCTKDGCTTSVVVTMKPREWRPAEFYEALRNLGWSPAPALCPKHSKGARS